MQHEGHRKRMRERYIRQGINGYAQHEILEMILFYAIPKRNVNPLAHKLIDSFGSLYAVINAPIEKLMQIDGVGEYTAVLITLFSKVFINAENEKIINRKRINSRNEAIEYCRSLFDGTNREMFFAICLDGNMNILGKSLIATGSLSSVPAYPRLVVETALTYNAHAVVVCHNHPGGKAKPSEDDNEVTSVLAKILENIEIKLLDHIIIGEDGAIGLISD